MFICLSRSVYCNARQITRRKKINDGIKYTKSFGFVFVCPLSRSVHLVNGKLCKVNEHCRLVIASTLFLFQQKDRKIKINKRNLCLSVAAQSSSHKVDIFFTLFSFIEWLNYLILFSLLLFQLFIRFFFFCHDDLHSKCWNNVFCLLICWLNDSLKFILLNLNIRRTQYKEKKD